MYFKHIFPLRNELKHKSSFFLRTDNTDSNRLKSMNPLTWNSQQLIRNEMMVEQLT